MGLVVGVVYLLDDFTCSLVSTLQLLGAQISLATLLQAVSGSLLVVVFFSSLHCNTQGIYRINTAVISLTRMASGEDLNGSGHALRVWT